MLDLEACWTAVKSRDATADGSFVYGVRTTGVYCRPGCTSRLPLRRNTVFFETTAAAEEAGLRACKRCRPTDVSAASRHVAAVEKACTLLRTSETMPSLGELADAACISRFHFHRVFKQITGVTPRDYARSHRLGRLGEKLDSGQPITASIYAAGFGSSSRAYEAAPAGLGMTPGTRRRGGSGETIRFVTVATPLGWALVAATGRGICMTAPEQNLDLPLDIRGTAFQARVWRALQKIPLGKTASYTEIAARLGQPKAVRAVAQACAANKLALVVPCHRVIRSDGELGGYRWGLERKRALLARERAAVAPDEAAA